MRLKRILLSAVLGLVGGSCSLTESDSELCFIGDSITYFWDVEYYFPGYHTWKHAVIGARAQDVDDWDISDCRGVPVVLLMGTNNIGDVAITDADAAQRREMFEKTFLDLAQQIDANPLWVISILPRRAEEKPTDEVNKNIELVNDMIRKDLDSLGNAFKYIDVFDYFLEDGYQANLRLFKDGLHLNVEGYELLTSKVQAEL